MMLLLNLLLGLAWVESCLGLTVKDFEPSLFTTSKPSAFYNIDTGVLNEGAVLGFGDLNGDK